MVNGGQGRARAIQWTLTSLQFEVLIFAHNRDRLPYPLWNARDAADDDDLYRQRREAIDSLATRVDDDLASVAGRLVNPEIRVLAHGYVGPNEASRVRAYAGIGRGAAGVAIQQPDPKPGVSGDVTVTLCKPVDVAGLLVDSLPEMSGGRKYKIDASRAELNTEPAEHSGWNRPLTPREKLDAFYRRRRCGWGEVTVYPGPFIDNRVTDDRAGFFWADFPGDGRYYISNDDQVTVFPLPRDRFTTTIDRVCHRVRGPLAS